MNFSETFSFIWQSGEPPGLRIARCCEIALAAGPMGHALRHDFYAQFISCGFEPALQHPFEAAHIDEIRTSCAMFGRAVLHWSGRRATHPGKVGQGIMDGWLEGLDMHSPSWTYADGQPPQGAIIYRDYSRHLSNMGHVQILVRETEPGRWLTAEGGGSLTSEEALALLKAGVKDIDVRHTNGTVCRLSAHPKDVFAKDGLGRIPIGWWDPSRLGLEDT